MMHVIFYSISHTYLCLMTTSFYKVGILLVSWVLLGSTQRLTPTEILRKMEAHTRGDKMYSEFTMQIERPRYTREMQMKSWAMGTDFSLILVTQPARERGIAYLKRYKEIWNYVPTIDRLIKLPPSMMSQSWMGSDLSNDDLVRESSLIDDYTHALVGRDTLLGYACYKLELVPKPSRPIVWSKVWIWIAETHFFQLKAVQFDERGDQVNTLLYSDVKQLGGRMMPAKMELIPHQKRGQKTVLIQNAVDFNPAISEEFFSIQNLKNVR